MHSVLTEDTRDGKRLRRTRQRLLKLAIGLATVAALLPAAASAITIPASPTSSPAAHMSVSTGQTIGGLVFRPECLLCAQGPIQNQAHHLCLDAMRQHDGSVGDKVQLWRCNGSINQEWRRNCNISGTCFNQIINDAHGLCLDAMRQHDGSDGDMVQLWRCNGSDNQEWFPSSSIWQNGAHSLCLDAMRQRDGSDGDNVQLWRCNGSINQKWAGDAP